MIDKLVQNNGVIDKMQTGLCDVEKACVEYHGPDETEQKLLDVIVGQVEVTKHTVRLLERLRR